MKKIMFYCQYLTGMGHLVRCTEILRHLVKDFKVCFLNGGQIVPQFEIPPDVEVINLPGIRIQNGKLIVVDISQDLKEVKESRKNKLIEVFEQFQPDCLITEFFPFGRRLHSFELIPLLDQVKLSGRSTKIVCSLRDIVMTPQYKNRAKREELVCQWMNDYFDLLLFHSDPKLQRLEESFSKVRDLNCEVCYTGYVTQSPPKTIPPSDEDIASLSQDQPMILASVGGGRHGSELLRTVVEASLILEQHLPHKIVAFTGPFMPKEQFLQLQQLALGKSNITVRRYTSHLIAHMEKADLSISLGGYNTTMNILRTGVRSLVFPSQSAQLTEQSIRADKLEKLGILDILHPSDLQPRDLANRIIACLNKRTVTNIPQRFDLRGAEKTAGLLKALLSCQVVAA